MLCEVILRPNVIKISRLRVPDLLVLIRLMLGKLGIEQRGHAFVFVQMLLGLLTFTLGGVVLNHVWQLVQRLLLVQGLRGLLVVAIAFCARPRNALKFVLNVHLIDVPTERVRRARRVVRGVL